jgi:hypothetical protein
VLRTSVWRSPANAGERKQNSVKIIATILMESPNILPEALPDPSTLEYLQD